MRDIADAPWIGLHREDWEDKIRRSAKEEEDDDDEDSGH